MPQLLLDCHLIGGGGADMATRCLPPWFIAEGWAGSRARVHPRADGVFLRAVAGLGAGMADVGPAYWTEHYTPEVEGFAQARAAGYGWLADTFAGAWRGFGRTVIAYLGPTDRLLRNRPLADLRATVQPILDAGAIPGLDSAAALVRDGATYRLCRHLVRDLGVRPYCEAAEVMPGQGFWCELGVSLITQTGAGTGSRLDLAYANPDGWMIARDARSRGGEYMALVIVDDKAKRLAVCRRWWAQGLSVATYLYDCTPEDVAFVRTGTRPAVAA